jgi:hypothetical protein
LKDPSRPRRLEEIAGDGVKLGGRLALGLLAAPLLGLALLATRTSKPGQAEVAETQPPVEPEPAVFPEQKADDPATVPDQIPGGPVRADIEDALRKLTEATIPTRAGKASRRKAPSSPAPSSEARPGKEPRRARPKGAADRVPVPPS